MTERPQTINIREAAFAAHRCGLCVVPPRQDGTKAPDGRWKDFQKRRPTEAELAACYSNGRTGLGLITGRVSRDLELLEFDDYPTYEAFLVRAADWSIDRLVQRVLDGYCARTPSGGIHLLYRCPVIEGNKKLARRHREPGEDDDEGIVTLIETRGEGGFTIEPPTFGSVHPTGLAYEQLTGGFETIQNIDADERESLFALSRSFDQIPQAEGAAAPKTGHNCGGRPGDDFNRRTSWDDIFRPHGWTYVYERDGLRFWRRPGKSIGISATTGLGRNGEDCLHVFTSSTPFDPEVKTYSKFAAYTLLNHGGDYAAATRALANDGYGQRKSDRQNCLSRDEATPPPQAAADDADTIQEAVDDPHRLARTLIDASAVNGDRTLQYYLGCVWRYDGAGYPIVSDEAARAILTKHIKTEFDADAQQRMTEADNDEPIHPRKVTTNIVNSTMNALYSETLVDDTVRTPTWIGEPIEGWNNPGDLLPMQNGVVNLRLFAEGRSDYFIPPTPRLFTTTGVDYAWTEPGPGVQAPTWQRFLRDLWPDDDQCIQTLQEWMGYILTPDTSQQKILFLKGPRRSGKGTINRVMGKLIGERNTCGPQFDSFSDSFALDELLGKSLATFADSRVGPRSNRGLITERLLNISGEDPVSINRKYKSRLTRVLQTRLVIMSNELPDLPDPSGALQGRYLILPFRNTFYGREDPTLKDKLFGELAAILHWALEGRKRLHERGRFVMPDSAATELAELQKLSSPIRTFVDERCELGATFSIAKGSLYAAYCAWCNREGVRSVSEPVFGRDLMAAESTVTPARPRTKDGPRDRVYRGIRLQT